ncbi:MAG: hypothetical protein WC647_10435 [Desulfomonilaceae bacterium]|jgi:AGZA family xanthine/uracil permease-like MFS transporter
MKQAHSNYKWIGLGDVNGFFGLMFDNIAQLSFLAGTLIVGFNFPSDVVYTRMIPGTTMGVLFGDLVYTWMAFRLAKRTGSTDVTAMPLGLDTPSTIGIALTVLGPAFIAMKQAGESPENAAIMTWQIGMATMVMIGILKIFMSFGGNWVQKIVPRAGLLGSIAGVGLALIGFIPLVDIFGLPVVGMISLGLVLYTLVARGSFPKNLPGILVAIVIGTILYHLYNFLIPDGSSTQTYIKPAFDLHFGLPWPSLDFVGGIVPALKYLPISIPFAILTVVGGINVTESARVAGDDYSARQILLTEAWTTLLAGICGGVAQSCPYIGHPAYKRMGARAGYTLLTAIFVGLGGMLGYVSFIVELIPKAVLAPILVFISLEIVAQAFTYSPTRHIPAVVLAMFPTVSRLISIQLENPNIIPVQNLHDMMSRVGSALPEPLVMLALGNGFILTGMLWGSFLAEMIDHHLKRCSFYLAILAVFSFFGIIHSSSLDANVYFPWLLEGVQRQIPYQFGMAYLCLAILMFALSFTKENSS